MIDTSKQYTYNGKPVRIYADGSDTHLGGILHCAFLSDTGWIQISLLESDLVEVWEPKRKGISMTKEDTLFHKLHIELLSSNDISATLDEFFSQNVVIPRGESRHPYADVLHELVEGTIVEARAIGNSTNNWSEAKLFNFDFEYRIKKTEPVYEWKYSFSTYGHKLTTDNFMTDEEARKYQLPLIFSKIEETKRVRNA